MPHPRALSPATHRAPFTPFCPKVLAFCAVPLACAHSPARPSGPDTPAQEVTRLIKESVSAKREVGFSYAVVSTAGPLFSLTHGKRDAALDGPVDQTTLFLSASTTKVITALAVLRLVDQGTLSLDDPLTSHLPEQPYGDGVTIRMLLNHSSGVPNPLPLHWVHRQDIRAEYSETRALAVELAQHPRLKAAPGERYLYSNLGYWLLGAVIERASGKKYAHFVRDELLVPLAIEPTELTFAPDLSVPPARGHYERFSLLGLALPLLTDKAIREAPSGRWGRFESLLMNGPAYGGAFANTRGYGKLLTGLLDENSRLLSADSLQMLFTDETNRSGQSLGVSIAFRAGSLHGVRSWSKPGGGPGFSSNLRIYPSLGLATVFLSNRMRVSEKDIEEVSDRLDGPFVQAQQEILADR